jgi:hypothetical protein
MNSTNLNEIANQVAGALSAQGYHLTGNQLMSYGAVIAAGVRWLHFEIPYLIGLWRSVGGFGGLLRFLKTGSSTLPPK